MSRVAGADVAIIMGSQSDWPTMRHAADRLDELGVRYEARIASAHRTPDRVVAFAKGAQAAGYKIIVAGAKPILLSSCRISPGCPTDSTWQAALCGQTGRLRATPAPMSTTVRESARAHATRQAPK